MSNTASSKGTEPSYASIRMVGDGVRNHFFGYYNKSSWHPADPLLLSHRVPMMTGDLMGTEQAEIGFFDLDRNDAFTNIGATTAWNWQMGAQLQWLECRGRLKAAGRKIIYNIRRSDLSSLSVFAGTDEGVQNRKLPYPEFRSIIHDSGSGENRVLPLPVYVVSPDSRYALCVDYSRFQFTHRTIGYPSTAAEPELELAPSSDGIWRMNLETGDFELVLSLKNLMDNEHRASMDRAVHWVTHVEISPDSSRVVFIHRWTERVEDELCFLHRLYTVNPDGSDLCLLECSDHPVPQLAEKFDPDAAGVFDWQKSPYQISHPSWKDNSRIIVWSPHEGKIAYHLYTDRSAAVEVIGEGILTQNGHMTYRRGDERWLLTDTYPDAAASERMLMLFHTQEQTCRSLGTYYTPPELGKDNRCDLHPRWNPDQTLLSIDSVHEGSRQQYILDIASLVG